MIAESPPTHCAVIVMRTSRISTGPPNHGHDVQNDVGYKYDSVRLSVFSYD